VFYCLDETGIEFYLWFYFRIYPTKEKTCHFNR